MKTAVFPPRGEGLPQGNVWLINERFHPQRVVHFSMKFDLTS
jgi:hypothetical protein